MATAPADLSIRQAGHVASPITVVEFSDRRLIDAARIEQLGKQILDIVKKADVPKLVLSFAKVEYLSSSALNVLIQIHKLIEQKSGQMRLAHLDPELQKIFTLMKLHKVMKMCDTVDDAIKSIKG